VIHQLHVRVLLPHLLQQRLDELIQVIDLLQLAAAILIQLAVTRQNVQLLEQLDRLPGADLGYRGGSGSTGRRCFLYSFFLAHALT